MVKHRASGTVATLCGLAAAWTVAAVSAQTPAPLYQSPFADAPPARVGQASRSGGASVRLIVLAPNRKGASAKPSPRLAWFLSAPSSNPLEIVVQERGADVPLLERRFQSAGAGGLQSIDLNEFDIQLTEGKEYEWSVALINDPARRASDQFSKGVVQYLPSSEALPTGEPEAVVSEYLSRGYWYDAIGVMEQALRGEAPSPGMEALSQRVFAAEQLAVQP